MWLALPPMAVHYHDHVTPSVSRDQYTALPMVGVLVTWYRRINNYINYINESYQILKSELIKYFHSLQTLPLKVLSGQAWISYSYFLFENLLFSIQISLQKLSTRI